MHHIWSTLVRAQLVTKPWSYRWVDAPLFIFKRITLPFHIVGKLVLGFSRGCRMQSWKRIRFYYPSPGSFSTRKSWRRSLIGKLLELWRWSMWRSAFFAWRPVSMRKERVLNSRSLNDRFLAHSMLGWMDEQAKEKEACQNSTMEKVATLVRTSGGNAQGLRYVEADYGQRRHGCKPSTNETKAVDLCGGLLFVNKDGLIHYFDKGAF